VTFVYILVAILVLMFMITVHELGHYIAGKSLGFKINEFSIGFGKALFKRTSKKTGEVFAIRMIPLGGYCAFEGEDEAGTPGMEKPEEQQRGYFDTTADEKPATPAIPFNKMPPWKRLIALFSGAFANFVCAVIFSFILLMAVGYNHTATINKMDPMSHNKGVLHEGDIVHEINGNKFSLLNNYMTQLAKFGAGEEIRLTVERDGEILPDPVIVTRAEIKPIEYVDLGGGHIVQREGDPYVGIGITNQHIDYQKMAFGPAIGKAFVFSGELAWLVLSFLGKMVIGQVSLSDIGGPMSTVSVMSQSVSVSMLNLLILIPLISVNLAVFNLLPIPALDGARMVFVGIEWVRKRPVNPNLEGKIHLIGLMVLLGLILVLDLNYLLFSRLMLYNMLC